MTSGQHEQRQQHTASAGTQRQRRTQRPDQTDDRRPQSHRYNQHAIPLRLEIKHDTNQRRGHQQRNAGGKPVRRDLGQRRQPQRLGGDDEQVERAVLEVVLKQPIKGQHRG